MMELCQRRYKKRASTMVITPELLTRETFKEYGQVIEVPSAEAGESANQGSASRFNYLATLQNLRNGKEWGIPQHIKSPTASLNVCLFQSKPRQIPFQVKLLERHKYSSQLFIPMTNQHHAAYLVVVALNDPVYEKPDMSTMRVFIGSSTQAFNYRAGVWHHPMIALYSQIDFVCFVYERNQNQVVDTEDCEEIYFPPQSISISLHKANL